MATSGYFAECPCCFGKHLEVCEDTKLGSLIYPGVVAFCLDCGWETWVEEAQADLEDVNFRREGWEMEPLKELKKRVF